jgi:hypothetical protein
MTASRFFINKPSLSVRPWRIDLQMDEKDFENPLSFRKLIPSIIQIIKRHSMKMDVANSDSGTDAANKPIIITAGLIGSVFIVAVGMNLR